jgi:hypothetical protein
MKKSPSIKNIAKALQLFNMKVDVIKKDATNPFFKSSYASLPHILDAINIPLIESNLALTMFPSGEHGLYCILLHTESGEYFASEYIMKPTKDTPHEKGSCLSYQRRYCISSILNLQIDDLLKDDDGNKASEQSQDQQKSQQKDNEKKWLNKGTDEYKKAIAYMQTENADINRILKSYRLSKETESFLLNLKK